LNFNFRLRIPTTSSKVRALRLVSYVDNEDPKSDIWYLRAGPEKGSAELSLTVVNDLNLMTTGRVTLTIE